MNLFLANTNDSDEGLRISRPRPEVVPENRNLWFVFIIFSYLNVVLQYQLQELQLED